MLLTIFILYLDFIFCILIHEKLCVLEPLANGPEFVEGHDWMIRQATPFGFNSNVSWFALDPVHSYLLDFTYIWFEPLDFSNLPGPFGAFEPSRHPGWIERTTTGYLYYSTTLIDLKHEIRNNTNFLSLLVRFCFEIMPVILLSS